MSCASSDLICTHGTGAQVSTGESRAGCAVHERAPSRGATGEAGEDGRRRRRWVQGGWGGRCCEKAAAAAHLALVGLALLLLGEAPAHAQTANAHASRLVRGADGRDRRADGRACGRERRVDRASQLRLSLLSLLVALELGDAVEKL